MRRREFIAGLGSAAAWPVVARAQQPTLPVVGFLSPFEVPNSMAAFHRGLAQIGFVESRNVTIEYHNWQNDSSRLPKLAADLVRRKCAVIVTVSSAPATRAAMTATSTIPIVFTTATDPVQTGLVVSLNRPGGNVTGFTERNVEVTPKRLELLKLLVPGASRFAALVDPAAVAVESVVAELQTAATARGWQLEVFSAGTMREVETAFSGFGQKRIDAVVVVNSSGFFAAREELAALSLRFKIPAIYWDRGLAEAGGLISYGVNIAALHHQAGVYTGRILKGEKPGELPVQQATTFELLINLKTARQQGLEIPPTLLALADEVID
jgi:putative tryptophan/tyrosine transport system substrate-binding protein